MSERNKTVLVDMDGLMVDFDTAALLNVSKKDRLERRSYHVADSYSAEQAQLIKNTYKAPGFFESLEVMSGLL